MLFHVNGHTLITGLVPVGAALHAIPSTGPLFDHGLVPVGAGLLPAERAAMARRSDVKLL